MVVARCMHLGALIHAGLGMGIHLVWSMLIHVWRYMLIQGGASAHGHSRMERGREVSGETKTSSTSTLSGVWRPAVGEVSPLQRASESMHDKAWVGRVMSSSLRISQEVEISTGCGDGVPAFQLQTLQPQHLVVEVRLGDGWGGHQW